MNCGSIDCLIIKHFDSGLNEKECLLLERHLKRCKRCSEAYELMHDVLADSFQNKMMDVSEEFEQSVMNRIRTAGEMQKSIKKSIDIQVFTVFYIFALAASIFFIVFYALGGAFLINSAVSLWNNPGQITSFIISAAEYIKDIYSVLSSVYRVFSSGAKAVIEYNYPVIIGTAAVLIVIHRFVRTGMAGKGGEHA